jgi:gliding motility-associated-like protein
MRRSFHIILLLICCIMPLMVKAQPYMGTNNRMEVDEIKGCAPFEFTVTHPSCLAGNCSARFRDINTNALLKDTTFTSGDKLKLKTPGQVKLEIITSFSGNNDDIILTAIANVKPSYEVYACQSGSVQVKITDMQYDHYKINGAGAEATRDAGDPPFAYTFPLPQPATTIIRVRGVNDNMADNCADSSKTVPVGSIPAININQVTVTNSSAVLLDHNANEAVQYRLMASTNNATSFQFVRTIYDPPVNTETVSSILPDNNYYCFRMDIFSPCNSAVIGSSNVVCSINFDATAQNNYNALSWTTGSAATNFSLTRDGAGIALSTTDANVTCNVPYTYQLTANFGTATSISLQKTVTATSTNKPDEVSNISSIVEGEQVVLNWQQPAGYTSSGYTIRKTVGPNTGPIGNPAGLSFTDNNYIPQACYTIQYDDACGNTSDISAPACPIVLTHTLQEDNTITLTWTPYSGWDQGVGQYEIYQDGSLLTTSTANTLTIPNDIEQQVHTYTIVAVPAEVTDPAITPSSSNVVEIIKAPNLYYPTAFVPGSALAENRRFKVFSQFTASFEFKIFNRWGELMFYTTDLSSDGWDGTYKGNPMPEGTYVFTAKITDFAGRTFDRAGTIVLLRK